MFRLEVLGDFFELVDGAPAFLIEFSHGIFKAVVDVVLDEDLLGLGDRFLDRVQLLGEVQAGALFIHHLQDAAQMTLRALEARSDRVMVVVGSLDRHAGNNIPPRRMWTIKPHDHHGNLLCRRLYFWL